MDINRLINAEPTPTVRTVILAWVGSIILLMWVGTRVIDWQITHGVGSVALAAGLVIFLVLEFFYWHFYVRYSFKRNNRDRRVVYGAITGTVYIALSAAVNEATGLMWPFWMGAGTSVLSVFGPISLLSVRLPTGDT